MQKKISIIIVTYNSQEFINGCLDSIADHLDISPRELEVIIVDNSSGINADEIKQLTVAHFLGQMVDVKYIHNSANLGYGQGNNMGINASSGEIICIMNPDVKLVTPLFGDVVTKFKNDQLALLAYKQIGGLNYSFYIKPEYRNRFFGFITKIANKADVFLPKYFYLSGAFFFVDRKKFEEVNYFDENIFMYFEEPDIANRLQKRGYKVKYNKTKIFHHLVGDRIQWSEISYSRENDSLMYYMKKYSIDEVKYLKEMIAEVKLKLKIARILKDHKRMDSFENELQLRQNFLKDFK